MKMRVCLFSLLLAGCALPAVQVATMALRGKSAVDFYEAAITNPEQLQQLTQKIQTHFRGNPLRYEDLDNDLAWQLGWFNKGILGLERIELAPEPSLEHPFGNFSITLKKVTFNQCLVLANYQSISDSFFQVYLNDELIALGGLNQEGLRLECLLELPFMSGNNEIRYVSY